MSSYVKLADRQKILSEGRMGFLAKPFGRDGLLQRVREALA